MNTNTPRPATPVSRNRDAKAWWEKLFVWLRHGIYPLISISCLIGIWETVAFFHLADLTLFPPPSRFLGYLLEENFSIGIGPERVSLGSAITASFLRALAGLTIGFIAALSLGIVISLSKTASRLIIPLIQLCAPISPVAWIPFSIIFFGVGDMSAVFIVFIGIVFLLTLATVSAIHNVDSGLLNAAAVLGTRNHQQWRYIIIPAILPQVFTLLRTNFFAAWMAVLAAEMVGTKNGLGAIILVGRESFNPSLILLGMTLIGSCGWLIDILLAGIQRRLFWWQASTVN